MGLTTTQQYRYIGGLRNRDGNVTWTVGVTASGPVEAKLALAAIFCEKIGRTVRLVDVGIVRRQTI